MIRSGGRSPHEWDEYPCKRDGSRLPYRFRLRVHRRWPPTDQEWFFRSHQPVGALILDFPGSGTMIKKLWKLSVGGISTQSLSLRYACCSSLCGPRQNLSVCWAHHWASCVCRSDLNQCTEDTENWTNGYSTTQIPKWPWDNPMWDRSELCWKAGRAELILAPRPT